MENCTCSKEHPTDFEISTYFEKVLKDNVINSIAILTLPTKIATTVKEVFDKDSFSAGDAIRVSHHTGEIFNAIIMDCDYEYIQCYRVGRDLQAKLVEIPLEEYLADAWLIKKL